MKKITFILLLALSAIAGSVNAQVTPTTITDGQFAPGTVFYRIKFTTTANGSQYVKVSGNDVQATGTQSEGGLFAFVGDNTNGYKIYESNSTTKCVYLTETNSAFVDNVNYGESTTHDKWTIFTRTSNYSVLYQTGVYTTNTSLPSTLNYPSGETSLKTWSDNEAKNSDNNCRITFEPVSMSLLYNYDFNGTVIQQTLLGTIGSTYPDPTFPAFCASTDSKPSGNVVVGGTNTATFSTTWSGPFEYSSTLENAKWYLMTLGYQDDHKQVFRFSTTGADINLPINDYTFTYSTKDQFAFVGNPINGFNIINRSSGNPRLVANSNGTGNPSFATAASSSQSDKWDIYDVTSNSESTITVPGTPFGLKLHGSNTAKLNRSGSSHNVVFWGNHDNGSSFTVSQADLPDLTLNAFEGKTYASFYADYPVKVTSENVTVYTGTVSGTSLNMTEAADKIIPAEVGVVLVGNAADVTTAAFSISNESGTLSKGHIIGTTSELPITDYQDQCLVLGVSNEEPRSVGFFRPTVEVIPANKAYISLATLSVNGLIFDFDGATTAIEPATLETAKTQNIYDLSGRRVSKASKGIYIKDGKKIYVK